MKLDIKFSNLGLALQLLRLGLAAVFLWFGFSQLIDSLNWVNLVPDWAVQLAHIPPAMIVLGNGLFEVILGSLMATNLLVRIPALILALHLIPIAAGFGLSANAVRDFGLIIACISLALAYGAHEAPNMVPGEITVSLPQEKPLGS